MLQLRTSPYYYVSPLQWLPPKWQVQWLFLVYRWVIALYFLGWLIDSGIQSGGPKFFIYLTNWSIILWVAYLLVAAVSATFKFIIVHLQQTAYSDHASTSDRPELIEVSQGCCGIESDGTSWYQKIQWLLWTFGSGAAISVVILYWAAIYDEDQEVDGINANTHLTNGIVALFDIWFSGTPVRILHLVYIVLFGAAFSLFSGIYFVAGGEDPFGNRYIYTVLDYSDNPGSAAGICIAATLALLPLVHFVVYVQYVLRVWCIRLIWKHCCNKSEEDHNNDGIGFDKESETLRMDEV